MHRDAEGAGVEQLGLAVAVALLALVAPVAVAIALAGAMIHLFVARRREGGADTMSLRALLALTGVASAGGVFGLPGIVGALLVWRSGAEIARSRETQGLSEPLWLAVAYRWAPLCAALLFRIGAPSWATAAAGLLAVVALGDWSLRRLAEWRLGEPQPFDTKAYLSSQARVLALVLLIPDTFAALAAFVTLALVRTVEQRPRPVRTYLAAA